MVEFKFRVADNSRISPLQTQTIFKQNGMYRNFKVCYHISNWIELDYLLLTQWNQLKLFALPLKRNWLKSCFHFVYIFSIAYMHYLLHRSISRGNRTELSFVWCVNLLDNSCIVCIEWIGFDHGTTATIYHIICATMFATVYDFLFHSIERIVCYCVWFTSSLRAVWKEINLTRHSSE